VAAFKKSEAGVFVCFILHSEKGKYLFSVLKLHLSCLITASLKTKQTCTEKHSFFHLFISTSMPFSFNITFFSLNYLNFIKAPFYLVLKYLC